MSVTVQLHAFVYGELVPGSARGLLCPVDQMVSTSRCRLLERAEARRKQSKRAPKQRPTLRSVSENDCFSVGNELDCAPRWLPRQTASRATPMGQYPPNTRISWKPGVETFAETGSISDTKAIRKRTERGYPRRRRNRHLPRCGNTIASVVRSGSICKLRHEAIDPYIQTKFKRGAKSI